MPAIVAFAVMVTVVSADALLSVKFASFSASLICAVFVYTVPAVADGETVASKLTVPLAPMANVPRSQVISWPETKQLPQLSLMYVSPAGRKSLSWTPVAAVSAEGLF